MTWIRFSEGARGFSTPPRQNCIWGPTRLLSYLNRR